MTHRPAASSCLVVSALLAIHASTSAQQPGLNNQPMFVLPFRSSVNAPRLEVFSITNLGTDQSSYAIVGRGFIGLGGESTVPGGTGITGIANGSGAYGVEGLSHGGTGVFGRNTSGDRDGVWGLGLRGVRGISWSASGSGVMGVFRKDSSSSGSTDPTAKGMHDGETRGWLGTPTNGVQGSSDVPGGFGVAGKADGDEKSVGIYGQSVNGFAGFFRGKVTITDGLLVNEVNASKLTSGQKLFKIDHPVDPAGKFLYHASIESDELKNLYDGVVILDAAGKATVTLPAWFEALNKDFRYQLTCIGGYAPVYIDREISQGRFRIAGGRPGLKVSWLVTGIRHDAHAKANPLVPEQAKGPGERGRYLTPR